MNRILRSATGTVALLIATIVSTNEVNAQSNYQTNSLWNAPSSQPFSGGVNALSPNNFLVAPSTTYSNPSYNYWSGTRNQGQSWSPQPNPTIRQNVAQTQPFQGTTYRQQPTVSWSTFAPSNGNAVQCQPGGA